MSSDTIYSYYEVDKNGQVWREPLGEHVETALEIVKNIENSSVGRYAGLLGVKDFSEIVRLTIVFHDIGKIFYQQQPSKKNEFTMSFRGHEFLSVYVFNKTVGGIRWLLESEIDLLFPIRFAILFHHHAMNMEKRSYEPPVILNRVDKEAVSRITPLLLKELDRFLEADEKDALKSGLAKISETLQDKTLGPYFRGLAVDLRVNTWRDWISPSKNPNTKKFTLLLLSVLLVADNLAADKTRPKSVSTYKNVLREFGNIYCNLSNSS